MSNYQRVNPMNNGDIYGNIIGKYEKIQQIPENIGKSSK